MISIEVGFRAQRGAVSWDGPGAAPVVEGLEAALAERVVASLRAPISAPRPRGPGADNDDVVAVDPLANAGAFTYALMRLPGELGVLPDWSTGKGLP